MLQKSGLSAKQLAYLSILESNLKDIVSPFLRGLSAQNTGLTPREIEVADLIRIGKTSKEIAELLNLSTRAIEFHRENIRAKLGLKNKPANLRSHLMSLS
jgi:DNA-binding CsgD family transcriptional regulator